LGGYVPLLPLRSGDIVDVIAPASGCSRSDLNNGLRAIRELGFVPRASKHILKKSLLFANSDEQRLAQLKAAIFAKDSRMIWCLRGGYGTLRLLPEMAGWKRPAQAKIFMGYSDITTLHTFFHQQWNWPTFHGPVVERLGRGGLTARELKEALAVIGGSSSEVEFSGLKALNGAARKARMIRGPLVGGNMAVLQSGLGTPYALNPRGKILFFEDINERPHRVDRMLTQMSQAGWFAHCRAVVLGNFLLSEAADRRGVWQDVIPRFARTLKVPLVAGLAVGHGERQQRTLPLNTLAHLTLGSRPNLVVSTEVLHP
jgi:muramoyltetrapeptide carboxypeptidase